MGLFEQFPYTNYDRLNLDALIRIVRSLQQHVDELDAVKEELQQIAADLTARMDSLDADVEEIKELYDSFVATIEQRFTNLEASLRDDQELFRQEVNLRISNFETTTTARVDGLASYIATLERELNDTLNNLPSVIEIVSPYTGELTTLEAVIYQLANQGRTDSLTAGEYDALNLTAGTYDAKGLTAFEYDWQGKTLLP